MSNKIECPIIFTNPKLQYENSWYVTRENLYIKIVEYINDNDCVVVFPSNGYITHSTISNIVTGNVYNPYNQKAKDLNPLFSSKTDEWYTPIDFFDELNQEFQFTLDPCSTDQNHKCPKYYTMADNGLNHSWAGERVFCNPPYSEIYDWVEKAFYETKNPNTLVVLLIPSRTDTKYFHNFIMNRAEIRFIRGRLKFGGAKNSAPFPSMLVIFRGPCV